MKKYCLIVLNIFILCVFIFCCAACFHALRVLRAYNVRLQEGIFQLSLEQEEQAKEMRVMKTNNEIVYDLVINKEWEK